jgi:hypothetical protein
VGKTQRFAIAALEPGHLVFLLVAWARRVSSLAAWDAPLSGPGPIFYRGRLIRRPIETGQILFVVVLPDDLASCRIHKVDAAAHDASNGLIGVLALLRHLVGGPALNAESGGRAAVNE